MTYFLNLEDVTELGILLMAQQGQGFLISDAGLLDSALQRPQASAFGEPAYPTLWGQAAALMQSLARNHTLVDGRKRMVHRPLNPTTGQQNGALVVVKERTLFFAAPVLQRKQQRMPRGS